MYWGLALFLTGSGLNVTCINMMLTQRFAPDDDRREGAFLWNYAGMNVGFFIGFAVAGHYQLTESYSSLFLFATVGNFLAIVLATHQLEDGWRTATRRCSERRPQDYRRRFAIGVAILLGSCRVVWFMLQHTGSTEIDVEGFARAVRARGAGLPDAEAPGRAREEQHVGLPDPRRWARSCSGRCTRWRRTACSCSP